MTHALDGTMMTTQYTLTRRCRYIPKSRRGISRGRDLVAGGIPIARVMSFKSSAHTQYSYATLRIHLNTIPAHYSDPAITNQTQRYHVHSIPMRRARRDLVVCA